jgi:hypothetical protein
VKLKDVVDFVAATLAANGARAVLRASVVTALAPVEQALAAELPAIRAPATAEDGVAVTHQMINARLSALAEPRLGAVTIQVP